MSIFVTSEIAPLRRVLLHRPGAELEHLVPGELERLLFDDIPFLKTAREEHQAFADTLEKCGAEVLYLEDLLAEVLQDQPDLREGFLRQFISEGGSFANRVSEPLYEYLNSFSDPLELVQKTMSGVALSELGRRSASPLVDLLGPSKHFVLDPIPNLYFTRDPFASIGTGVSLHRMYSMTRSRETIYSEYVLRYHPLFAGKVPFYYHRNEPFHIEGGDILNLSENVLAVGISQRTSAEAIEALAHHLFEAEECRIDTILALYIPGMRAFMHLDTVFTQVDHGRFVIHPGILGPLRLFRITRGNARVRSDGSVSYALRVRELSAPLSDVLSKLLPAEKVSLIQCGGSDRIASEREQWNDGSNTLCVSPGRVIAYDRNYITNEILRNEGIEVLEIKSSELSRGRGGPRCMSMPLQREALS